KIVQDCIRQKRTLWVCVLLIAISGLYPPWTAVGRFRHPLGYHWLFLPPDGYSIGLDFGLLALEWVVICAVGLALYFAWPVAPLQISFQRLRGHAETIAMVIISVVGLLGVFVIIAS